MSGVSRKIFWSEGLAEHPSITRPTEEAKARLLCLPFRPERPGRRGFPSSNLTYSRGHTVQPVTARVLSRVRLLATPGTVAHQAPLSMGFSRQEHWSGLPFPSPGDLPNPGIEPTSLESPASAGRFLATVPPGKPFRLKSPEVRAQIFAEPRPDVSGSAGDRDGLSRGPCAHRPSLFKSHCSSSAVPRTAPPCFTRPVRFA